MFIAHLPGGYLLTRHIQNRIGNHSLSLRITGLVASIFPDFDLAYFFLIDHRQHPHHEYLTHMPVFWLTLALVTYLMARATRLFWLIPYIGVVLVNLMLHMVMDSVMAEIYWLYPFSDAAVNLLHITKRYGWWVLNFALHWTFLIEIFIALLAFDVWMTDGKKYSHCR